MNEKSLNPPSHPCPSAFQINEEKKKKKGREGGRKEEKREAELEGSKLDYSTLDAEI